MALDGTTTELLVSIRADARIADDDPSATDTILLAEATRIQHRTYAPAVRKCRSEYYVTAARIALEADRRSYSIPRRATTSTVRRVRILDSSGRPVTQLSVVSLEDIGYASGPTPVVYAITDSQLVVYPTPNAATHTLEIMFEYRPGALVLPAAAALATYAWISADKEHRFLTADPSPFVEGDLFDAVCVDAPFETPILDAVVSQLSFADTITHTQDYMGRREDLGFPGLNTPKVYLCTAGESPIPQIPLELHPCLAMHTAAKFLTPIDPQGAADLKMNADQDMVAVLEAMTPRQQGTQQRMRPRVRNVRTGGWGGGRGGGTFGDMA